MLNLKMRILRFDYQLVRLSAIQWIFMSIIQPHAVIFSGVSD